MAERYSNDKNSPNDICLQLKLSLKKVATPPPFLCVLTTSRLLKLGGADSIRIGALLSLSSHVSVTNKKSSLWELIKLLIKNDLFARDLALKGASLSC